MKKHLLFIGFFCYFVGIFAQMPGRIDSTFGTNGVTVAGLGGYSRTGTAMFAADSSILVSGEQMHGVPQVYASTALATGHFSKNGALISFGESGGWYGNYGTKPYGLAQLSTGNMLVVGETWFPHQVGPGGWNYVVQNNASAEMFTAAGVNISSASISTNPSASPYVHTYGRAIALLANDNFIWGIVQDSTVELRYYTSSFSLYKTISKTYQNPYPIAIFHQIDSSLLSCVRIGNDSLVINKFLPNGTLDLAFGINGNIGFGNINCLTIKRLKDNRIVIYGETKLIFLYPNMSVQKIVNLQCTPSTYTSYTTSSPNSFLIAPNDKIVTTSPKGFHLTCYNPDGTLDNTFGTNGVSDTFPSTQSNYTSAVLLQTDGKLIAFGWGDGYFTLVRYFGTDFLSEVTTSNLPALTNASRLQVFPNPARENIQLIFELAEQSRLGISLYNAAGQEIQLFSENTLYKAGQNEVSLDFDSKIQAGVYFLCLKEGDRRQYLKVMKM